jgi:hypothetical protein
MERRAPNYTFLMNPMTGWRRSSEIGSGRKYESLLLAITVVWVLTLPLVFIQLEEANSGPSIFVAIAGFALLCTVTSSNQHRFLRRILFISFLYRISYSAANIYVYQSVYQGIGDTLSYFATGQEIAKSFSWGYFAEPSAWFQTELIYTLSGLGQALFGQSLATMTILWAMIGWAGAALWIFTIAKPAKLAGDNIPLLLIALSPSLAFFTSYLGKDPLFLFGTGSVIYSLKKVMEGSLRYIFVILAVTGLMAMVRPHIAAIVAGSLFSAFLCHKQLAAWKKAVLLPLVMASATVVFVVFIQAYEVEDLQGAVGIADSNVDAVTTAGGSATDAVNQSVVVRIAYAPLVMFRPFPWEVTSATSVIASAEGMLWLVLLVRRRRTFLSNIRLAANNGLLAFCVTFFALGSIMIAAVLSSNYGLIARQRAMIIPMFFALTLDWKKSQADPARISKREMHALIPAGA